MDIPAVGVCDCAWVARWDLYGVLVALMAFVLLRVIAVALLLYALTFVAHGQ